MSYQDMWDFSPYEVVQASDMDILRENIELEQSPPIAGGAVLLGNFPTNSTSWTLVNAGYRTSFVSTGGVWDFWYTVPISHVVAGGVYYLTFYLDGVNIGDPTYGLMGTAVNIGGVVHNVRKVMQVDAGSHNLDLYHRVSNSANTWEVYNGSTLITMRAREL